MPGTPAWYYKGRHGFVGPLTAIALRRLIEAGEIEPSTPVRRGEEGSWLQAGRLQEHPLPIAEVETPEGYPVEDIERGETDAVGNEMAEWFLSRNDRGKMGPVPRSILVAMAGRGQLAPEDRVWRAGMASWARAADCTDLAGLFPSAGDSIGPPTAVLQGRRLPALTFQGIAAASLATAALLAILVWTWSSDNRGMVPVDPAARPAPGATIASTPSASELTTPGDVKPSLKKDPESFFREARTALHRGELDRARSLLDQYLSLPDITGTANARVLRREIDLATSAAEAEALAQRLGDQEIREHLATGGRLLANQAVRSPELRSTYAQTLLRALSQEMDRRRTAPARGPLMAQMPPAAPRRAPEAVVQAGPPEAPEEADRLPASLLGVDDEAAPDPAKARHQSSQLTIETILDAPGEFEGRTIALDGLYRVGTLLTKLRGEDRNIIGWSLPIGGDDDRLICKGNGKVAGRDRYLILDSGLAPLLLKTYDELKFRPAARPMHKCALTVRVRPLLVNGARVPVVTIVQLEILGVCNFLLIAQRQYEKAFLMVHVTPETAWVDHGDGPSWVERLGGEEKFVRPLRRKLRDMQRRAIVDRQNAIVGSLLQAQLAQAVNMTIANQQQQARFVAAFFNSR